MIFCAYGSNSIIAGYARIADDMANIEQRPIRIENGEAVQDGHLRVTVYDRRDRLVRAAKLWGLCWLLAAITVFIPILHFVLVPGFLLAGPIWAYVRYQIVVSFDGISGKCPAHQGVINIALEGDKMPPAWAYCPECDAALRLVVKS